MASNAQFNREWDAGLGCVESGDTQHTRRRRRPPLAHLKFVYSFGRTERKTRKYALSLFSGTLAMRQTRSVRKLSHVTRTRNED